jgi:hypothetical protein
MDVSMVEFAMVMRPKVTQAYRTVKSRFQLETS